MYNRKPTPRLQEKKMSTTTIHTQEEIARNINALANAIYTEYELYTEKNVQVDSDHFNKLEEIMTIVSEIGQYIATGAEENGSMIKEYTEIYLDGTKDIVKRERERAARIAAEAAAKKAYDEAMAAALKEGN
jgi:hypothetical protein